MNTESLTDRPVVRLKPGGRKKRPQRGSPWIFANEVAMNAAAKALPPGEIVRLETDAGEALGAYVFNKHPLICARRLSHDPAARIDEAFLAERLRRAAAVRDRLIGAPYYRLVHAEADGLPGTIVDRFDDVLVLQVNTAGMDRLLPQLTAALEATLAPRAIVLRNDSAARELEGLSSDVRMLKGQLDGPLELVENGTRFLADPREGQKTGWFYDQRDNRAFAARLAQGARVLDGYCYTGGFAVQAALGGAAEVVAIDRSQPALDLAAQSAKLNGVEERCCFVKADVFGELQRRRDAGEAFDTVIVDPPAFVKSKKDYWQGLKGYRKLTRLAAALVARGGYLVACSCSHHVTPDDFGEQVRRGLSEVGRDGRILRFAGAGPDHPVHPSLPETGYLKAQALALD
ncbi:class I SAM-dependent rRNA methyltransferase [Ferruginivarius sediminum]|uniref:Class I SAM-dependent rRNA methyltransferase n=1 Tax=Ferruginivarius sediminum TaxID=2661937 RepID=A0A369TGF4_9PROT|nr:class I SAM-dependent rRNA methyltransferase [Ferruginivarius sediminum]RDD63217.1 class I SAM-dependent rRNA methyltransferase [Ferruginivarius sediminum]